MSHHAVNVLGINITIQSKEKILEQTKKYLTENAKLKHQKSEETVKPFVIVTPNPEQIVLAGQDKHFFQILNWADLAIPDGIGVVWAAQFLDRGSFGRKITDGMRRIPGVDLMQDLVRQAANEGFAIGLIGGRGGLAVKTLECLRQKHPQIRGWGMDGPEASVQENHLHLHTENSVVEGVTTISTGDLPRLAPITIAGDGSEAVSTYMDTLIREVSRTRTDMLFVAMGAPKQEYFIEQFVASWIRQEREMKRRIEPDIPLVELHPLIIMAVGGSFDFIAGKTPRAPEAIQNRGLEWLWRLLREPWRFKRQLALIHYVERVLRTRLAPLVLASIAS